MWHSGTLKDAVFIFLIWYLHGFECQWYCLTNGGYKLLFLENTCSKLCCINLFIFIWPKYLECFTYIKWNSTSFLSSHLPSSNRCDILKHFMTDVDNGFLLDTVINYLLSLIYPYIQTYILKQRKRQQIHMSIWIKDRSYL